MVGCRRGPGQARRRPGLDPRQPALLLAELAGGGADACIFDPDLDPTGGYATLVTGTIAGGLSGLGGPGGVERSVGSCGRRPAPGSA